MYTRRTVLLYPSHALARKHTHARTHRDLQTHTHTTHTTHTHPNTHTPHTRTHTHTHTHTHFSLSLPQASSLKPRVSEVPLKVSVALLFLVIVVGVPLIFHFYRIQLHLLEIGAAIKFNEITRHMDVERADGVSPAETPFRVAENTRVHVASSVKAFSHACSCLGLPPSVDQR